MNPFAKVVSLLAVILFVVPPIVAVIAVDDSDGSPAGDIEGFAAGMIVAACWFIGFLLAVVGGIVAALSARERRKHPLPSGKTDGGATGVLGRYVDGRWVCYEHDQRWCPICAARIRRPGDAPESPPAEELSDGQTRT